MRPEPDIAGDVIHWLARGAGFAAACGARRRVRRLSPLIEHLSCPACQALAGVTPDRQAEAARPRCH